ncbi:MAG: carboxypeptidase-like regulatory domain-containing protein [Terriglobales bacterium]
MKLFVALLGSLLLLSMLGVAAYGQNAGTGAIAGVVTDPTGAVVEGVVVKVTNNLTGETRTAVSAGRGNYTEPLLPPGNYAVEASKAGFKNTSYRAITVSVTEILTLNIQLQVGSVQETVEVTGQGEQLQTETSAAGRVTDSIVVESMPLVTRNYTQILALSTGVSADVMKASELGRGGTSGGGSNPNDDMVTAGGAGNDNNFQMNGVEVNDFQQSGNFSGGVAVPNPDSIQEFKVQTGQYDASYGRNAGANVNVVTKTGTNEFHGTVFEFFRNDALNANDWFLNENGVPRQELRQNQYGMTFGGPIVKNKLLFFTSYQGTRQTNGVDPTCSTTFTTPPLTNDRSAAALGALFYGQPTFIQEATGLPLGPSVAQDGSNISAPALALLQMKLPNGQYLYPTPQRIDGSLPFSEQGSYSVSNPCTFYEEQFMTNADWNQSDKSQWQVRFFFANSSQANTLPATDLGGPTAPGFPYVTKQHFRNFSLTYNHTFSNNLLNQAEIGYHRISSSDVQQEVFSYPQIGVTISPGPTDENPVIYAAGLPTVGGNGQNVILAQNTYVAEDTVAWQKGHHAIRFGGGVTRPQDNQAAFQFFGGLIFLTPSDFLLGQAGDTSLPPGLQFGNVYGSIDLPLEGAREWRVLDANAYFQDDYKVTSRLTLNLGLRYERLGDVSDALGRVANFNQYAADPNPPTGGSYQGIVVASNYNGPALPTGVQKGNNKLGIAGDNQNTWDPRIGFAWMIPGNDKVVLRGGYGVSHTHTTGEAFLQTVSNQPWGLIREQLGTDPTVTFANPFAFPGQPSTLPAFTPYSPGSALSPFTFNNHWRPGMLQRYSLNLQTELRKDMMLEIGYIGTRGLHLTQQVLPDQALDASPSNPIRGQTDNTLANLYQRVPVQGFGISTWRQINSEGASWYNGLEASLTKRFSHGVQLLASYTWAKELSTDFSSSTSPNGGESIGNQYLQSARYGPDLFVRPQRFVASYVYAPPYFEHRGALLRNTLSGWKIAGVTTIQNGHPLAVQNTNAFNLYGINGTDDDFAQLAPNCTVSQVSSSGSVQSKINHFINQSCFENVATGQPTPYPVISSDGGTAFGNTRPGILRGPGQNNTDLSLIKNFSPRWPNENAAVEFRAELFNAFNHPQFSDPGYAVDGASFGAITTAAVAPRIAQFALKLSF